MLKLLVDFREVWLILALIELGIGSILLLGRDAWNGWVPAGGLAVGQFFCEALRDGTIRQPVNAWSSTGFMFVALAIACMIGRDGRRGRIPMNGSRGIAALYATLVTLLGLGSMCLHASWTLWGGTMDVCSMLLFATFLVSRGLSPPGSPAVLIVTYVLITTPLLTFYLCTLSWSTLLFGTLLVVFMLGELAPVPAGWMRQRNADRRWLAAAAAAFLVGLGVWIPSRNGGALCCPTCLLQGHAAWHGCCALGTGFLFLYFRSERRIPPAGSSHLS